MLTISGGTALREVLLERLPTQPNSRVDALLLHPMGAEPAIRRLVGALMLKQNVE